MSWKNVWMVGWLFLTTACVTAPQAPPPQPEVHIRNGIKLLKRGNCRAAQEQFEKALRIDPDNFHAYFGLGASALVCRKPDKARGTLQIALRLAPSPLWKDRTEILLAVASGEDRPRRSHKHKHAADRKHDGVSVELILRWLEE